METKIVCVVCGTEVPLSEISQFAAFGGLPSPCCKICFSVNDHSCKTIEEVIRRSLLKRIEMSKNQQETERK